MIAPSEQRRRRSRRRWLPWVAGLVTAVVLLVVGIAVGMSLRDNPRPDLTVTTTKTVNP